MNTTDTNPENTPPAIPQAPVPPHTPFSVPGGLRGWLTFLGLCHLSTGILGCITIIGLLPGIPLIIAGSALLNARSALDEPAEIEDFLKKIRTAVIGISSLYLASTLLFLLSLIILIPLFGMAIATHGADLF